MILWFLTQKSILCAQMATIQMPGSLRVYYLGQCSGPLELCHLSGKDFSAPFSRGSPAFPWPWGSSSLPTRQDAFRKGSTETQRRCCNTLTFGKLGMKEWKRNGNYYNGLYRDFYKDPCLHS